MPRKWGTEEHGKNIIARGRRWQIPKTDDALHAQHDPRCGAGEADHGAKSCPNDQFRRQRQNGGRYNDIEIFGSAGEKDEILGNIAAAAERRESKDGARGRRIEREQRKAGSTLIPAVSQPQRDQADRGGEEENTRHINIVGKCIERQIEEGERNQSAGSADDGEPEPFTLRASERFFSG
ncbi:hypothetical protein [Sinorhizobium fredii]|uniref:hypothetical protein n=1 Tax=Rhizobium fredii TaxID=380 RepID=UPI00351341E2